VLKAENSEKENSAKPPLASPEEENREVDRTSAIIPTLNVLVDQLHVENPRSQFSWSFCGPGEHLFSLMKARWTSVGLPEDADALVKWLQSPVNYRPLRAAGLLVSFPPHPRNGPEIMIRVERETNQEVYQPLVDGVRR
jgi:hypothetical protein